MSSRRERKKAQTRAALLGAATSLFADRGIAATRVEDITNAIDLGKGAFYNYFDSKDALVAALVADGLGELEERFATGLTGTDDLRERVRLLAGLQAEFFDEHPHYALLFHEVCGLLHLEDTQVEQLRAVLSGYLARVGALMVPPDTDRSWTDDELLDVSAAVAGSIAGYRWLRVAAGLPAGRDTPVTTLAHGVPELLAEREGSSS